MAETNRYLSYRTVLRKRFGGPVLKVALNGGFTCPNRDGTISTQGCSFCDAPSFSPASLRHADAARQLAQVIEIQRHRFALFLPYLQPFSNTYAPVERLIDVYESLLSFPGVVGLCIGTRPDCLTPDCLAYLERRARSAYICVELGLQSISDAVLALNRRGHTFDDFIRATRALSSRGIEVVAHLLFGMRGDTEENMVAAGEQLAALPVTGVKIHQLMIIEGTLTAQWYHEGLVSPLELPQYCSLVAEVVNRLRPDQQIHRLVADTTVERGLIAPLWSCRKTEALAALRNYFTSHDVLQGRSFKSCSTDGVPVTENPRSHNLAK